jgi:thiol-disulfide isomerase/thioredoxin
MNHEDYFNDHKYILAYVDDFSKDCRKCKRAREILEETLKLMSEKFKMKMAFINRKTDSALLKKLKLFENRRFAYLANNRAVPFRDDVWNPRSIARWLKKRMIKPSNAFMYDVDFEGHEKVYPRIVTYVGKRNKYYYMFRYVASSYEDIHFLHSFSPPVLHSRNRTVEFTKNPEKTSFLIRVPFTIDEINELIETHNNVQRVLDPTTLARIMTKEDLTFLLLHNNPSHPAVTHMFRTGLKMKDHALFISAPLQGKKYMLKLCRWLGLNPDKTQLPLLRIIARENGQMRKYAFTGDKINEESITKLYENYMAGQLKPYFLSEDVPQAQSGAAKKVVGSNFDAVVGNRLKDVIVFFHSIYCAQCKDIMAIFESLAGKFSGYEDVQFVHVDSYENEGLRIPDGGDGEPVLKLFKADDKKKPLRYRGQWLQGDMQRWVEQNLNLKVDL